MKTKSGKLGVNKAAILVIIMIVVTVQLGFGQMVGFNGKLPKKSLRTKYKCEHIGVQKVKHAKVRMSPKKDIQEVVYVQNEIITVSNSPVEPKFLIEPKVETEEEKAPIVVDKEEVAKKRLLPMPVYFRYDSYRMDIIDLTQIALAVNYVMEGNSITLIGHTDDWGSEKYNEVLSEKRANIIRDMMIELGCKPELIIARGEGEKYPVHTNEHEEGRRNNRRVEFMISMSGN